MLACGGKAALPPCGGGNRPKGVRSARSIWRRPPERMPSNSARLGLALPVIERAAVGPKHANAAEADRACRIGDASVRSPFSAPIASVISASNAACSSASSAALTKSWSRPSSCHRMLPPAVGTFENPRSSRQLISPPPGAPGAGEPVGPTQLRQGGDARRLIPIAIHECEKSGHHRPLPPPQDRRRIRAQQEHIKNITTHPALTGEGG